MYCFCTTQLLTNKTNNIREAVKQQGSGLTPELTLLVAELLDAVKVLRRNKPDCYWTEVWFPPVCADWLPKTAAKCPNFDKLLAILEPVLPSGIRTAATAANEPFWLTMTPSWPECRLESEKGKEVHVTLTTGIDVNMTLGSMFAHGGFGDIFKCVAAFTSHIFSWCQSFILMYMLLSFPVCGLAKHRSPRLPSCYGLRHRTRPPSQMPYWRERLWLSICATLDSFRVWSLSESLGTVSR